MSPGRATGRGADTRWVGRSVPDPLGAVALNFCLREGGRAEGGGRNQRELTVQGKEGRHAVAELPAEIGNRNVDVLLPLNLSAPRVAASMVVGLSPGASHDH